MSEVRDFIWERLSGWGIKRIFGFSGDGIWADGGARPHWRHLRIRRRSKKGGQARAKWDGARQNLIVEGYCLEKALTVEVVWRRVKRIQQVKRVR